MKSELAQFGTVDEALLAGYVEGDLTPEDELRVERQVSREGMASLLAMRADAQTLRSMGEVAAPAGLLAGVADAIERDLLLNMRDEGEDLGGVPAGRRRTRHGPALGGKFGHAMRSRQAALAAVLALLVGGGALVLPTLMRGGPGRSGPGPLVLAPRPEGERDLALLDPPVPTEIPASGFEPGPAHRDLALEPAPSMADPGAKPELTLAQAARLLGERRLVLRAKATNVEDLRSWLARIDERGGSVRLCEFVPGEVAHALLTPEPGAPDGGAPGRGPAPIAMASEGEGPDRIDLRERTSGALVTRFEPVVLMLEVNAESQTLEAALRAFKARTGFDAVLEEVAEPMPLPGARPAADELLWWTRPASEWKTRALLPVVIEPPGMK
ncbi:MAG: hypothetical protein IT439_06450 [Phycisphaerales bacterium]|nr:hypothetical protein [Phycisphaerales bacterium]